MACRTSSTRPLAACAAAGCMPEAQSRSPPPRIMLPARSWSSAALEVLEYLPTTRAQGAGRGWIAAGRARRALRKGMTGTIHLKGLRARTPFDGESCDAPGASARSPLDVNRGAPDVFDDLTEKTDAAQRLSRPFRRVGRLPPALERPALPKSVARCDRIGQVAAMVSRSKPLCCIAPHVK